MRRFEPGSRGNAIFAGGLTHAPWRGRESGLDGASQHETLDTTGSSDCQGNTYVENRVQWSVEAIPRNDICYRSKKILAFSTCLGT